MTYPQILYVFFKKRALELFLRIEGDDQGQASLYRQQEICLTHALRLMNYWARAENPILTKHKVSREFRINFTESGKEVKEHILGIVETLKKVNEVEE